MAKLWDIIQKIITFVLIIILAYRYRNKFKARTCDANDTQCADEYFSVDYAEAREKFLKYSKNIKTANTYNIPIYTKGDETLYTDITILNENSKSNHIMLHLSGVHGTEGFTGSGLQIALLKHISNPVKNNKFGTLSFETDDDSEKPIIILVHAVNPYGFSKIRRVNEDNIDLNRNFKTDKQWEQFKANGPNKFHYDDLNAVVNPNSRLQMASSIISKIPKPFRQYFINIYHNFNYALCWLKAAYFAMFHGTKTMKIAVTVGQMHNAKGWQYVGDGKLASSHDKLKAFLTNKFEEHVDWKTQIKKVTMIDVHSGDSQYGIDKLLTDKSENALKLKQLFLDYDDKDLIQSVQSDGNEKDTLFLDGIYDNVNGYTFAYGDLIVSFTADKEKVDVLAFASEFGSNHMLETVGFCQILENSYFQEYNEYVKGSVNKEENEVMKVFVEKSKKWLKDVFYLNDPEWKKIVIKRGFRVFGGCLNR